MCSPYGITARLLTKWCLPRVNNLRSEVAEAVNRLFLRLKDCQFGKTIKLDGGAFSGVLSDVMPEGGSVTVLTELSQAFAEEELRSLSEQERIKLEEGFRALLLEMATEPGNTGSLAEVTLGFALGTLEEFIRSTFRLSRFGETVTWLDANDWGTRHPGQAFLIRGLRVLARLGEDPFFDFKADLSGQPQSAVEAFVIQLADARASANRTDLTSGARSLVDWLTSIADPEVRAEALLGLVNALERTTESRVPDRHRIVWQVLTALEPQFVTGTPGRCLVLQQKLAFLNRTKSRSGVVDDGNAFELIRSHSRELIRTGFDAEDIQLICDGMFYYVRSQELSRARVSYTDVLGYRSALQFISAVQGRVGRRLQLLLTEGSLHRHFCREDDLPWEEFRRHMEDGVTCYVRAFRSALARGRCRYVLDAVSYICDFCFKSLRYRAEPQARRVIVEHAQEAWRRAKEVESQMTPSGRGGEEIDVIRIIQLSYPLLGVVGCVEVCQRGGTVPPDVVTSFGDVASALSALASEGYSLDSKKLLQTTLKRVEWALSFGHVCGAAGALSRALENDLETILRVTRPRGRSDKLASKWRAIFHLSAVGGVAAVVGDLVAERGAVERDLRRAVDAGMTVNELKEWFPTVVCDAWCGTSEGARLVKLAEQVVGRLRP